jgi:hypothetical protein
MKLTHLRLQQTIIQTLAFLTGIGKEAVIELILEKLNA